LTDYKKLQLDVPFIRNEITGCQVTDLWRLCKFMESKLEAHTKHGKDACTASSEAGTLQNPTMSRRNMFSPSSQQQLAEALVLPRKDSARQSPSFRPPGVLNNQ
jgi:hypothetical protein